MLNVQLYLFNQMIKKLIELLITFVLLDFSYGAGVGWNIHEDIRTGQQIMYSQPSATSFFRAIDVPVSYYIVYSSSISSTRAAGVGIVGFHSIISYDYSMNTTVQNFTTYALRITARVYGDTVLSFYAVDWIAVGNIPNFIQVLFNCHLCTNLKVGRGDRLQTRTGITLFAGYQLLYVNVYLSGFSLRNVDGITNYLSATASIASGSNIINYKFMTNQNNTVSQMCYTTIIYNDFVTKTLYYDWGWTGSTVLSNKATQTPSTLGFPSAFPNNAVDYRDRDKMFFGMSTFNLSRASNRKFYLDTTQYGNLNTNYATNQGTYAVTIDFFMIAVRSCNASDRWFDVYDMDCQNDCNNSAAITNPGDRYETNPGSFCYGCHYTCQNCTGSHSNQCKDCDQLMFREQVGTTCPCNASYIDIGIKLCYPCQSYIPGCDTCQSTILCLTCFPGFLLQPNGLCECTSGFLVSGVCTNITGCTSLVMYAGTAFCLACNSTLNYQTTSAYTCQCMAGYYVSGNRLCLPTCGDARQVTEEGCDDGNTVNGDGCSSTCFTQTNWICIGGSPTNRSICYVYDPSMSMQIKYVRRQTTLNRMQVGVKILPSYPQLQLINFKQFLTHNVPCSYFNATYYNNYLVLQFDYNYTIQSQFFDLYLQLDPNVFYNTTLYAQIPASGMNAKLTYDQVNTVNRPFQIIVIILDVLAIIVMFVTCISERMIGIQMIQTLQTVLYTQAVMKTTPSSLSPLQMLRYSSGYNEIQGIDYGRTFTYAFSLSSLGLQKQFLLSYNLMFIILVAVAIFCIILKAKQYYHESKLGKFTQEEDEQKNISKLQTTTKIYNFVFERVLFLVAFMSMFLIIFALMLQLTDMKSDYTVMSKEFNLLGTGIAMAVLCTMICAVILNGCFPGTLLFPMLMKQYYPPIYFLYQSTFIFLLAFDYTQQYILYILLAMSFIFMVYNVLHRPYPQRFHTFVLIFHQILIMGVIGVYIFENLNKPTENQTLYKILNGVIVALLYIVVVLNAYRLYKYYLFIKQNGWDQYGNQEYADNNNDKLNDDDNLRYKQLKSSRYNQTPKKDDEKGYKNNSKNNKNNEPVELQEVKKTNKDNSKSKPVQDESAMNWKYNKLADDDNNPRYQATNRDARPDTSRDKPLNKSRTTDKNKDGDVSFNNSRLNDTNNLDDDNTVKDLDGRNKNKPYNGDDSKLNNDNQGENDNDNVFDNPYDEKGYAKKNSPTNNIEQDDDPLKRIKRRLKQDFNSKLKTSTMKQY